MESELSQRFYRNLNLTNPKAPVDFTTDVIEKAEQEVIKQLNYVKEKIEYALEQNTVHIIIPGEECIVQQFNEAFADGKSAVTAARSKIGIPRLLLKRKAVIFFHYLKFSQRKF